jgi:hypothetical protein
MRIHTLFFSALFGTQLIASQTIDLSPSLAMDDLRSARPCIGSECSPHSYGAALETSFLLWQAREDGLDFALNNKSSNLTDVNGVMTGIHFGWEPAWKVNLDQSLSNSWDFDMRWTYFYSRSTASHHAATDALTGSGLLPIWVLPQSNLASPNVFGKARGIWHIHLNTTDLELGYLPFLTKKLSLRIHAGFKGVSISQQFTVHYSNGIDDGTITLLPSKAALRNRCLGIGPRIGFNSQWQLKKGWSILADGSTCMSLCVFNLKRKDIDQSIADNGSVFYEEFSKFRESFYAFRPIFEGLLGIRWSTCYGCKKQYSFALDAAYEVQYYWEQNMMRQMASESVSFSAFSMRGDLHCHGITTTFRFGF